MVLEKTLESPLDCKEIKPVNPKGNQSWIFIGRTDAEAEAPILWPSDVKKWLTGKDSDAGKDSWQEEKGTIQDEMVGWHHRLHTHEFEQALGDGEGQWNLACRSPWGCKESDMTEQLNWTEIDQLPRTSCSVLLQVQLLKNTLSGYFLHPRFSICVRMCVYVVVCISFCFCLTNFLQDLILVSFSYWLWDDIAMIRVARYCQNLHTPVLCTVFIKLLGMC